MAAERRFRMTSKRIMSCSITILFALWGAMSVASASTSRAGAPPVCELTAHRMFTACNLDVREELNITIANCMNIADMRAGQACRNEALLARGEEMELCEDQHDARVEVCELLGENRYDPDPLLDPTIDFIDPDDIPDLHAANPYLSLVAGHTYVLRAGEEGEETVVVHVTDQTREILGVACRIVVDAVVQAEADEDSGEIEYEAAEITDDWFAQDETGSVYYCGELSRDFEDGLLEGIDGSFEAGKDFAKAGTLMRAFPAVGDADRQEFALEEAEDIVEYVDLAAGPTEEMGGENPAFPCDGGCLQTHDS